MTRRSRAPKTYTVARWTHVDFTMDTGAFLTNRDEMEVWLKQSSSKQTDARVTRSFDANKDEIQDLSDPKWNLNHLIPRYLHTWEIAFEEAADAMEFFMAWHGCDGIQIEIRKS